MISRSSSRLARFGVPALLAALTLGSCVQDQDFLVIERAVWYDDSCVMNSGSTTTAYPTMVDVAWEGEFGIGLIVNNELTPYEGSNSGIDDSEIVVETAEVTLSFSGGGVAGGSFEAPIPSNSIEGGGSDVFLIRIPASVTDSLRASMQGNPNTEVLEMEVVIKGHRNQYGDSKLGAIESRPYVYPFDICYGCLGTCVECDDMSVACPSPDAYAGSCGFIQNVITGVCPG